MYKLSIFYNYSLYVSSISRFIFCSMDIALAYNTVSTIKSVDKSLIIMAEVGKNEMKSKECLDRAFFTIKTRNTSYLFLLMRTVYTLYVYPILNSIYQCRTSSAFQLPLHTQCNHNGYFSSSLPLCLP